MSRGPCRRHNAFATRGETEARGINFCRPRGGMIVESWLGIDLATIRAQTASQHELSEAR